MGNYEVIIFLNKTEATKKTSIAYKYNNCAF